eukprot:Skav218368  [mRNA]  locus=scaffold2066:180575:187564:+ [translate_table: standard]
MITKLDREQHDASSLLSHELRDDKGGQGTLGTAVFGGEDHGGRGEEPEAPSEATPTQRFKSYFSPKFSAAGCRALQLELRVLKGTGNRSPGPSSDNCSLHLWCPKNTQLHVRFYAGEKWVTMEKAQDIDGPLGAKRMGLLQETGVDKMQCKMVKQGPMAAYALKNCEVESFADLESLQISPRRVEWLLTEADQLHGAQPSSWALGYPWVLVDADSNAWTVLPRERQFPHDHPICSPVFSAGGVMISVSPQPSETSLNTALCSVSGGWHAVHFLSSWISRFDRVRHGTKGFCSLFLYCPSGVNIKCNLNAGNQKRDASNYFQEAGAFGRCNFCRFDSAIDSDCG